VHVLGHSVVHPMPVGCSNSERTTLTELDGTCVTFGFIKLMVKISKR